MKAQHTLFIFALAASPCMAKLAQHSGISGEVAVSAGYVSSKSNFDTKADKRINGLNQDASTDSRGVIIPLGNLAYTFGPELDKQVYVGTSREDIAVGALALEVGYKQQLSSGTIVDVSVLPSVMSREVWEDPFVEGEKRHKTDEDGMAYRLKLSNINGSNFSLDTAYGTREVDDELSGTTQLSQAQSKLLDRDLDWYLVRGSYRVALNESSYLVPTLTYTSTDADGDANSSDSVRAEATYAALFDHHKLAITAGYTKRSFDEKNPLFDKKRDENIYSLFAAYEYRLSGDWQDWSVISLAGYKNTDSDIEFYDKSQFLTTVGMSYHF